MTGVSLGAAVLAVWLWSRPSDDVRRRLAPTPTTVPVMQRPWVRRLSIGIGALGVVVVLGVLAGPAAAAVALAVLIAAGAGIRLVRLAAQTRAEHAVRTEVANACSVIANQVRVGRIPAEALVVAAEDAAVLAVPSRVQRTGGDVVGALLDQAAAPGCQGLRDLARAWRVGTSTGAPMADLLDQVAKALRADQAVERTVGSELAGPRATGKMMAVLPLCGIGLGYVLGGDPIGFLVGGPLGWGCLVGGAALAAAGVLWIEWLARQVSGPL
jgi:tight adherence protein B